MNEHPARSDDARRVRRRTATLAALLTAAALTAAALITAAAAPASAATPAASPAASPAATPASSTSAVQFGGQCAEGLAEGRHVMTSCAVTWADAEGKTYCFSSEAAKKVFLANPQAQLRKAHDFIAASSVETTEKLMQDFDAADAETLVKAQIAGTLAKNNGVFPLVDSLDGTPLELAFDGIDFTRTIDGYGFFPDAKFHEAADPKKQYLIDFWVIPAQGQLKVQEVRIYKSPRAAEGGGWTLMARQPVPWWWIPASEHPGKVAQKRSWEVMSAVEQHALEEAAKNGGIFKLKDDKTGQVLDLEFIDTHQPIRQLDENGHFFACTDFRVVGTKDQIYDIDFWVNDKDGTLSVDQTKVHKVPELKDGQWVEVPRYEWKELGSSHVVP